MDEKPWAKRVLFAIVGLLGLTFAISGARGLVSRQLSTGAGWAYKGEDAAREGGMLLFFGVCLVALAIYLTVWNERDD